MKKFIRRFVLRRLDRLKAKGYNRRAAKIWQKKGLDKLPFDSQKINEHIKLWKQLLSKVNTTWYKLYSSVNGIEDPRYVPFDIHYCVIEPRLNNKRFIKAYADKNFSDLIHTDVKTPDTLLRRIDGVYYDRHYQRIDSGTLWDGGFFEELLSKGVHQIIAKQASDSGRGLSLRKFLLEKTHNNQDYKQGYPFRELDGFYKYDFLVQDNLNQHPCTAIFNPTSLNTIRVYVYRSVTTDKIHLLHYIQKVGKAGRVIDDSFRIGFNSAGKYNNFCTNHENTKFFEVNGLSLEGIPDFPFMEALKDCAIKVARKHIHSRVLGLDLAVDANGEIILVEVNNISIGIDMPQSCHGPLFGEFTDEVIQYCSKRMNSYSFYYDM